MYYYSMTSQFDRGFQDPTFRPRSLQENGIVPTLWEVKALRLQLVSYVDGAANSCPGRCSMIPDHIVPGLPRKAESTVDARRGAHCTRGRNPIGL